MLPYALTIFTGAFLLFQVQPLIGKYILPWFGGGPGVWTTCLLFFQTLLLGGYAYAHVTSTKLKPKSQAILHLVLLALSLTLLPITPSEAWKPELADDPTWQILLLLTMSIGLPYFVLSSTGPLMQQWFSLTNPGVSPYRLYALSNVGSLLALLSYPVFFEVQFSRHLQASMWSWGLGVFVLFCGYCTWRVWRHATARLPAPTESASSAETSVAAEPAPETQPVDKLLWVSLPAIASVLLLATTNKLCQEVAVIPFLWVLPLSLYLLTFIISFDHARWYHRGIFTGLLILGVAAVCQLLPAGSDAPMLQQIIVYTGTLFVACMVCHGELYRLRPPPQRLTAFYLSISAGGALGGFFVAIVAPAIFNDYRELQLGLWLLSYALGVVCFRHESRTIAFSAAIGALALTVFIPWLRSYFDDSEGVKDELLLFFRERWAYLLAGFVVILIGVFDVRRRGLIKEWRPRMGMFVMAISVALGAVFVVQWHDHGGTRVLNASRNFYGTLKVYDYYPTDQEDHYLLLLHGATTHGIQFVKPEKALLPTTYYTDGSGIGLAFDNLPEGPRRIGVVGLGTGSLAVYGREGDTMRIYEINSAVEKLARSPFKYLDYSPAKIEVVMGDARVVMERELAEKKPQQFDILALDAFSSDAIPVHLLTKEAFDTYLQHVKPDGIIAVHISNRYLDLQPIVEKLAEHFDLGVATISHDDDSDWWIYATTWVLMTRNKALLEKEEIRDAVDDKVVTKRPTPLWTDDYASLYSAIKVD